MPPGDEFDRLVTNHPFITAFGDICHDFLLSLSRSYHWLRRKFGRRYFSLAACVKHKVKYICQFVSNYHDSLIRSAKQKGADIVITGHIHRPEIVPLGEHANCGDRVENCAALVEHLDGRLEIIHAERDGHGAAPAEEMEEVAV